MMGMLSSQGIKQTLACSAVSGHINYYVARRTRASARGAIDVSSVGNHRYCAREKLERL
jgi:hypothetical protein